MAVPMAITLPLPSGRTPMAMPALLDQARMSWHSGATFSRYTPAPSSTGNPVMSCWVQTGSVKIGEMTRGRLYSGDEFNQPPAIFDVGAILILFGGERRVVKAPAHVRLD